MWPRVTLNTGRWAGTDRKDRLCQVCQSSQAVKDKQHCVVGCLAYKDINTQYASLFQQAFTVPDMIAKSDSSMWRFPQGVLSCTEVCLCSFRYVALF